LVWDDLFKGRGQPTDFIIETTFEIINYRYLNLLPTIINSERLPGALLDIDVAIGRRIIERSQGHIAIVEGIESNYSLSCGQAGWEDEDHLNTDAGAGVDINKFFWKGK
jgi:DNA replication protein DnaC